jgi:hypothetical protein
VPVGWVATAGESPATAVLEGPAGLVALVALVAPAVPAVAVAPGAALLVTA